MDTFVARQPILDRARRVIGYELLSRSSQTSAQFDNANGNHATAQVIANGVFGVGLEQIAKGKLAFINFTRDMLVDGFAEALPKHSVVIEILETVEPDPQVILACQKLKRIGYKLALDDYVDATRFQSLAACAEIVKFDVRCRPIACPSQLMKGFQGRLHKALAEKVETYDEFNRARALGYTYFQGYFFARPTMVAGKETPAMSLSYFHLLEAIQPSELDYHKIDKIIRQEVSFTYKLLRYINSAIFNRQGKIDSITQALLLMGDEEIRRWGSLLLLVGIGENKPRELMVLALMRARFCESMGSLAGLGQRKQALFLMGMFSLLDALMDRPLPEALKDLPLDNDVAGALIGNRVPDPRFSAICKLVQSYESGDWSGVSEQASQLEVPEDALPQIYSDAVDWSEKALAG